MTLQETIDALRTLALGANPDTGAVLPPDSHFHAPTAIRALFTAVEHLEALQSRQHKNLSASEKAATRQSENLRLGRPHNAGLPWSAELKQELASRFQAGESVERLARAFERTAVSILAQLVRQGLLTKDAAAQISQTSGREVRHALAQ